MSKEVKDIIITPETITADDVKRLISPVATDKEIAIFLQIAKLNKLNPFKREIYLVKFANQPAHIVTGYETYLKRAERSGKYAGFKVWTEGEGEGLKACIEVRRKDWDKPLYHEVEYEEYAQRKKDGSLTRFWKGKSKTMLKKVVISQAFRFAFPDELGGMPCTSEEMPIEAENSGNVPASTIQEPKPIRKPSQSSSRTPTNAHLSEDVPSKGNSTNITAPTPKNRESSDKPKSKSEEFKNAFKRLREKLGEKDFYSLLKSCGYNSLSEIKTISEAERIIGLMKQYEGNDGNN